MAIAAFLIRYRNSDEGAKTAVIKACTVLPPCEGSYELWRFHDENHEFVYGIRDFDVADVTALNADQAAEHERTETAREVERGWRLDSALTYLQQVLAPLPRTECAIIDGDILESGKRRCMIHNMPVGEDTVQCVASAAFDFLATQGHL